MSYRERAQEIEQLTSLTWVNNGHVIKDDFDPYAGHLHHTGPLKIFEREIRHILSQSRLPVAKQAALRDFICKVEAKYSDQVQIGNEVEVTTGMFQANPATLAFQQVMRRSGKEMVSAFIDLTTADNLDTSSLTRSIALENTNPIAKTQASYQIEEGVDPSTNRAHYTQALKILEDERIHVFEEHGMPVAELAKERGLFGFVFELGAKYNAPLALGDQIVVATTVFQTRPTILSFHQEIHKNWIPVVDAVVDVALVSKNKPVRIPQEVIDKLKAA